MTNVFPATTTRTIKRMDIPSGMTVRGTASDGEVWKGTMRKKGKVIPDRYCPPGLFNLTHAYVNYLWMPVVG